MSISPIFLLSEKIGIIGQKFVSFNRNINNLETGMRILKALFIGILFILAIIFATENTHEVGINYYGLMPVHVPLFLVVFASVMIGVFFAGILASIEQFRLKREINRLKKVKLTQEKELNSLRNLPLESSEHLKDKE